MEVLNKFSLLFLLAIYNQSVWCDLSSETLNERRNESLEDSVYDELVFAQIVCGKNFFTKSKQN